MSNYRQHVQCCESSPYVQALEQKQQALEQKLISCKQEYDSEVAKMRVELNEEQGRVRTLEASIATLSLTAGPTLLANYQYSLNNIHDLTKLIVNNLLEKPTRVDSNRIFNCVKKCYDECIRDHRGCTNSDIMIQLDAIVLLMSSYRSNWFTANQDSRGTDTFIKFCSRKLCNYVHTKFSILPSHYIVQPTNGMITVIT
jgi:hypothetical protein